MPKQQGQEINAARLPPPPPPPPHPVQRSTAYRGMCKFVGSTF